MSQSCWGLLPEETRIMENFIVPQFTVNSNYFPKEACLAIFKGFESRWVVGRKLLQRVHSGNLRTDQQHTVQNAGNLLRNLFFKVTSVNWFNCSFKVIEKITPFLHAFSLLDSSVTFDSQIYEVTQQECYGFSFYHHVYKKSKLSYRSF